jgi:hypothetical protein
MALMQMKCTALDIVAGTATLSPQLGVLRENEFRGLTSLLVAAAPNTLRPITWTLNAFYDVEISKAYS